MEVSSNQVEYLSSTLLKSRIPVTYHTLSRELKIHQNNAKHVLYEFYSANKEKIQASFIITGKNNQGHLIKLCNDESDLESSMKQFESIHSIHVYSLQAREAHMSYDNVVLEELKYRVDHAHIEEYFKIGMIKGPDMVVVEARLAPVQTGAATNKLTPASGSATSTSAPKSAGLSSGYVSRKASKDSRPAERSKTDTISNYTSRKTEASSKPAKRSTTAPTSGYQYKSRKLEKQQPKERVIISNEEAPDNDEDKVLVEREQKKNTSDLNNLFMDDFSDDSDQDQMEVEKEEPIVIHEKEKEKEKEPEPPKPAPVDRAPVRSSPVRSSSKPEPAKKVTDSVDDDGYLTSFKSNNPVKNKPDKKKTQSSLMNFFKPK